MCINYSLQSKNSKTMFIVYFCEFGMPYYLINLPKCNLTTNVNLYPTLMNNLINFYWSLN